MDDPLERAQAEIRHLKETIAALRAEIESQAFEYEEKLEKEKGDRRDERKHLQDTIAELRHAMEHGPKAHARKEA
jgi:FtsZ-binding cell division protein ZapB